VRDSTRHIINYLGREPAFYMDIGCGHPTYNNATMDLARMGWQGISIDIKPSIIERFAGQRRDETTLCADALEVDYHTFLKENDAPSVMGYLSINIQPDQRGKDILEKLPFTTHKFMMVSFTHNSQLENTNPRDESRQILSDRGYHLIDTVGPSKDSEDIYIHQDLR
tara:strand:- start:439 stop:939 length:501 start_codon:yes stop_codon:yes gene_type:complete